MALRILQFPSPKFIPQSSKSHTQSFHSTTYPKPSPIKIKFQISCSSSFNDADLALDLAFEVERMNTQLVQREEAMDKSRELLFSEICKYLGLEDGEVRKKWKRMGEDDKWVLVKGFVSDWGLHFHPLSAKSVKDMVEEHLVVEDNESTNSLLSFFPNFKKIMGFDEDY